MSEGKAKIVGQSLTDLASLTARINKVCGRAQLMEFSSIQSALNNAIWGSSFSPKDYTMDVVLGRDSLSALAAMEAQTKALSESIGLTQITSVATQLATISETLSAQTAFIKELIAPSSMLADLQKIAEQTHKAILDSGRLTSWQLGVLNSASFMVDRQIDWSSRFCTTTYEEAEPICQIEEIGDKPTSVNVIKMLPEELEEEKKKNEDITPGEALEKTQTFQVTERGKRLMERVVNINKICQRKNREPIFKYTNATILAATTLGGTVCTNNGNFGNVIDGLYFVFYENLEHIKDFVTDKAVRDEDVYQCIFRVKDIRTDLRHDYEHGKNIKKKTGDIAESYSHYTGKVVLTSSGDYTMAQEKLYDDFYALTDHLQKMIEIKS